MINMIQYGGSMHVIPNWVVGLGAFCILDVIGQTIRWAIHALAHQPR